MGNFWHHLEMHIAIRQSSKCVLTRGINDERWSICCLWSKKGSMWPLCMSTQPTVILQETSVLPLFCSLQLGEEHSSVIGFTSMSLWEWKTANRVVTVSCCGKAVNSECAEGSFYVSGGLWVAGGTNFTWSEVFAKGKTDGSSHQLFISIISYMLWFQILKKLLLPMEILPSWGKKWKLEAKERLFKNGNCSNVWLCSCAVRNGVVVLGNSLHQPRGWV